MSRNFDPDDHWGDREDDFDRKPVRQTAKGIGWVGVLAAVAVVVFGGLAIAIWGFGVFTSDVKGQGDSIVIKNEAQNRIRAQEGFWDKYQAVVVADQKITAHAELLKLKPGDLKIETELVGLKQVCLSAVGTYNATAMKFTQQDFRDAELPAQIDDTSPSTLDCKENK